MPNQAPSRIYCRRSDKFALSIFQHTNACPGNRREEALESLGASARSGSGTRQPLVRVATCSAALFVVPLPPTTKRPPGPHHIALLDGWTWTRTRGEIERPNDFKPPRRRGGDSDTHRNQSASATPRACVHPGRRLAVHDPPAPPPPPSSLTRARHATPRRTRSPTTTSSPSPSREAPSRAGALALPLKPHPSNIPISSRPPPSPSSCFVSSPLLSETDEPTRLDQKRASQPPAEAGVLLGRRSTEAGARAPRWRWTAAAESGEG